MPRTLRVSVEALALASLADDAAAQYFGRNKVQYRNFEFRVLKTEHFDLHYYPEEADAAADASRLAERWYARFSELLDHRLSGRATAHSLCRTCSRSTNEYDAPAHRRRDGMTSTRETGATAGISGAQRLPLWFVEGMAESTVPSLSFP